MTSARTLNDYLNAAYSFSVIADEESGYVIEYPDLPGCITQVESLSDIPGAADEIKTLWIETAFANDIPIPEPGSAETYSGKFNLRLPRSLHRQLADAAARDGVSLNQHVVSILSSGDSTIQIERRLERIEEAIQNVNDHVTSPMK